MLAGVQPRAVGDPREVMTTIFGPKVCFYLCESFFSPKGYLNMSLPLCKESLGNFAKPFRQSSNCSPLLLLQMAEAQYLASQLFIPRTCYCSGWEGEVQKYGKERS